MTKRRGIFYIALALCLGGGLARTRHRHDANTDKQISGETLPEADTAKIIINEHRHQIITLFREPNGSGRKGDQQQTQQRSVYLPAHAAVEVRKDGTIRVDVRTWGTELSPQFGLAYSDKARIFLGEGVFYYKRLDLVPFLAVGISGRVDGRAGLACAYNVWSNTHLFAGMQIDKTMVGGISFNF